MVESITPNEAAAIIARDDVLIVDVRDPDEFSAGHLPGAHAVPLDVLRQDPDRALAHAPSILFVCAKGARSLTAAKMAERLGYAKLYSLDGGTKEWARAGLPLVVDTTAAAA
jgi:rhodanese-related sulfurtransferase